MIKLKSKIIQFRLIFKTQNTMKKIFVLGGILAVILFPLIMLAQTDSAGVTSADGNTGAFKILSLDWAKVYAIFVVLGIAFEAIVRLFPTAQSYSGVRFVLLVLDDYFPDVKKGGQKFMGDGTKL